MSKQSDNNIPVFFCDVYRGLHIWHIMAQDNKEEWNNGTAGKTGYVY